MIKEQNESQRQSSRFFLNAHKRTFLFLFPLHGFNPFFEEGVCEKALHEETLVIADHYEGLGLRLRGRNLLVTGHNPYGYGEETLIKKKEHVIKKMKTDLEQSLIPIISSANQST